MLESLRAFLVDEGGATAIEYGLIAALVSVAAIGALGLMGNALATLFGAVANELQNAVNNSNAG